MNQMLKVVIWFLCEALMVQGLSHKVPKSLSLKETGSKIGIVTEPRHKVKTKEDQRVLHDKRVAESLSSRLAAGAPMLQRVERLAIFNNDVQPGDKDQNSIVLYLLLIGFMLIGISASSLYTTSSSSTPANRNGKAFRLLDRDAAFEQSKGNWNVTIEQKEHQAEISDLMWQDAFHTWLDTTTLWGMVLYYFAVYVIAFLLFVPCYLSVDIDCQLHLDGSIMRAYFLSMQTMVTLGFGLGKEPYNGCWPGAVLITTQSLLALILNAFVIGTLFLKLSRPQNRANTVVFSKQAVVREHDGGLYFVFRVAELSEKLLIETHVRCYCIYHHAGQTFHMSPMRLQQPDDENGAMLLTALPNQVVHRIDGWSPLAPSLKDLQELRGDATEIASGIDAGFGRHLRGRAWPDVPRRQTDAETGDRAGFACSTCGESYQTLEMLRKHNLYLSHQDAQSGVPEECCHKAWPEESGDALAGKDSGDAAGPEAGAGGPAGDSGAAGNDETQALSRQHSSTQDMSPLKFLKPPSRTEVEQYLQEKYVEVVVVLEGIEQSTSATVQARHSYVFSEEVNWDMDFEDCMVQSDGGCTVDLDKFHEVVKIEAAPVKA